MLDSVHLTFITPTTQAEQDEHWNEYKFLHHFVPNSITDDELRDVLDHSIGWNTLVYANGILIGCFLRDVYAKSVELHGICRPDIGQIIPKPGRVKTHIYRLLLDDCFLTLDREKVIIKAPPSYIGVRGFALMWGFTKLANMDKGRCVWKLTKTDYLRRIKDVQKECAASPALNSSVGV